MYSCNSCPLHLFLANIATSACIFISPSVDFPTHYSYREAELYSGIPCQLISAAMKLCDCLLKIYSTYLSFSQTKGHVFSNCAYYIIPSIRGHFVSMMCKISQYTILHSNTLFSISGLPCTLQQKTGVLKTFWATFFAKELTSTSKT